MSTHNVNLARFARNVEWDFFCDFEYFIGEFWQFFAVKKAWEFYERSSGFQTFHRRDVWKGKSIQIPLRHLILQRERDLCWVGEKQANQIDVNGCYIFSTFHTIKRPTFEEKGRKKKYLLSFSECFRVSS